MYRIRELRLKKGWSITKLAEESGVCRTTIFLLESQQSHVSTTKTLLAISKALGVSVGRLFL